MCLGVHVEVRGQLLGVGSVFLPLALKVIRLGGKDLYLLSHLVGPLLWNIILVGQR